MLNAVPVHLEKIEDDAAAARAKIEDRGQDISATNDKTKSKAGKQRCEEDLKLTNLLDEASSTGIFLLKNIRLHYLGVVSRLLKL